MNAETPVEARIASMMPDPRETARRMHRHAEELAQELSSPAALLDWAETLLCNSLPMSHCSQREWDELIGKWRDAKHGVKS